MKTMSTLLKLLGVILILGTTSCSNKDNDTDISGDDAICGIWKLQEVEDDDGEVISYSKDEFILTLDFDGTYTFRQKEWNASSQTFYPEYVEKGEYTYKENKGTLTMKENGNRGNEINIFEIVKLTSKQLVVELTDEDGYTETYYFEKTGELDNPDEDVEDEASIPGTWKLTKMEYTGEETVTFSKDEYILALNTDGTYIFRQKEWNSIKQDFNPEDIEEGTYTYKESSHKFTMKENGVRDSEAITYTVIKLTGKQFVVTFTHQDGDKETSYFEKVSK